MTPREALIAVGGEGKRSILAAIGWCLTGLDHTQRSAGVGAWQVSSKWHGAVPSSLEGQTVQAEKVLSEIWGAAGLSGQALDIDVPDHLALLCCAWRTPSAVETLLDKGSSIKEAVDRLPEGGRWKERAGLWLSGLGRSGPPTGIPGTKPAEAWKKPAGGTGWIALVFGGLSLAGLLWWAYGK